MNSRVACVRCGEEPVDPSRPCGFCRGEREREAVAILVAAIGNPSDAALLRRAEAIDTLRNLGHSKEQVLRARGLAVEGKSVEAILDSLGADERVEVAA